MTGKKKKHCSIIYQLCTTRLIQTFHGLHLLYTCIGYFWWNIQLIHKITIKREFLSLIFICLSPFKMSIGIRVFCLSCFLFRSFFSLSPIIFNTVAEWFSFKHLAGANIWDCAFQHLDVINTTVGKCHRQLTAQPKQTHTYRDPWDLI